VKQSPNLKDGIDASGKTKNKQKNKQTNKQPKNNN